MGNLSGTVGLFLCLDLRHQEEPWWTGIIVKYYVHTHAITKKHTDTTKNKLLWMYIQFYINKYYHTVKSGINGEDKCLRLIPWLQTAPPLVETKASSAQMAQTRGGRSDWRETTHRRAHLPVQDCQCFSLQWSRLWALPLSNNTKKEHGATCEL